MKVTTFLQIFHCSEKKTRSNTCIIFSFFSIFVFAHHSFCIVLFHDSIVLCSPLDYFPSLLFFRRLPHLEAPVMITSSVSNVNVSVQLGDTTPFALGFLSASAGTAGLSHAVSHVHAQSEKQVNVI